MILHQSAANLGSVDLPIVCSLTEAELRERRQTFLNSIQESALEVLEIENGYSYHFKPSPEVLARLANLVELERQCCQFLSFKIMVEPRQPFVLQVTGPTPETKALIADYFGS